MKKAIRLIALSLVLVMGLGMLASCGKTLSGEYKCDDTKILDVTLAFDGDTVKATGKLIVSVSVEGTYKIDGDKITLTFGDDKFNLSGTHSFEQSGKTIKIDGVSYTKQ